MAWRESRPPRASWREPTLRYRHTRSSSLQADEHPCVSAASENPAHSYRASGCRRPRNLARPQGSWRKNHVRSHMFECRALLCRTGPATRHATTRRHRPRARWLSHPAGAESHAFQYSRSFFHAVLNPCRLAQPARAATLGGAAAPGRLVRWRPPQARPDHHPDLHSFTLPAVGSSWPACAAGRELRPANRAKLLLTRRRILHAPVQYCGSPVTGWSSAPVATLMPIECRRPICQAAPLDDDRRRTIAGTLSALISLRTGTKPRPPGHRAVVVIASLGRRSSHCAWRCRASTLR